MGDMSADSRSGFYGKPFALLEISELFAGRREVWTATHGRATAYHVLVDDGMAACRPNPKFRGSHRTTRGTPRKKYDAIILCELTIIPIGEVPGHMTCGRNGCRQWFEAAIQ